MVAPRIGVTRATAWAALILLAGCGGGADTVDTGGGNLPPIANAGGGQTVFEGAQVSLNGAGSDPENDPLAFFWRQLSGPAVNIVSASTANASFTAPDVAAGAPETLTFELEVSDGVVSDTATVTYVVEENVPPVADAGPDRTVGPNVQVTLDGSLSDDANSIGQLSFAWTQVAGPAVTLNGAATSRPTFVSPVPGGASLQLEFQLAVSDGTFTATDTVTIVVDDDPGVNAPPVADAGPDQIVPPAIQVTLDGSGSSDPDSAQLSYSWTQTAGPAVALTGADSVAPVFTAPNLTGGPVQLIFQLTVSDGELSDSDTVTINVGDDDPDVNIPPVADAGPGQVVFEGDAVTLAGSGSDADGDPLDYVWTQLSGPAVTLSGTTTATTGFVAPDVPAGAPAELVFELTVSDGLASASDTVTVRVEQNEPPVADAGPDQTVTEDDEVALDGSGSTDPNSIGGLTFAWAQTGGTAVVLAGANTAQPTFTAPAVTADEVLTFELTVSDGTFSDADTVSITVEDIGNAAGIAGRISYEFVPPRANCSGLDFANTVVRPIRRATVQLLDASSGAVLDSTIADDSGDYEFTNVDVDTDVRLRVRAELKQTGAPGWNVEVRDNTGDTGSPLTSRPLYVMDGPTFNSGSGGGMTTHDLTATTGWDGSSYSADRTAAPFAVLDAIYSGMQLILSVDPGTSFEPLDAYWSVNNTTTNGDIGTGDIGTSFYSGNPDGGTRNPSLFLVGDAADDTDEFDDHLVVHEWGHYFEDSLSRSDSIGGPHALGQLLDARLAFGEGFATALAAMALDDPQYCDTGIPGTAGGFGINAESDNFGTQGWYNEVSVLTLLYDLWDDAVDQTDTDSIGFAPIYATMVGPQSSTPAFTSIFSFAAELRPMLDAAGQALLDSQLSRELIEPAADIWGGGETNDASNADVLPVYTNLTADGSVLNICTNSDFDSARTGNKLAEHRYLRLAVPATDAYDVLVETTTPTPATPAAGDNDQSDPDIYIYREGSIVAWGNSSQANVESFRSQSPLQTGVTYAVDVEEWRFDDPNAATTYPERICFDISFTPTP